MKKILFVLISFTMVSFVLLNMASAKSEADLFKIASILERENIVITDWSLYARGKLDTNQSINQMMKQFPQLDWKISEDERKWEAAAVLPKQSDVTETIRILSTAKETYITYEVKGTEWNKNTREFLQDDISQRIGAIFHGKTIIFSCVSGELGDKISTSLPDNAKELLKAFQAEEIETAEETSFISTSAYSPLFTETIKGQTEAMNLQLGMRDQGLGGKTTLVVGTPIVTIEY